MLTFQVNANIYRIVIPVDYQNNNSGYTMKFLLTIILLTVISIIGSRLTFLKRKFSMGFQNILLTGTEYIFVGILLGQMGLGFLDADAIVQLSPFLIFGLCWIGFLFGLQFEVRNIKKMPRFFFSITIVQSLLTFLLVSVAMVVVFHQFLEVKFSIIMIIALTLGSAASCTAQSALAIVDRRHRFSKPRLLNFLRYVSGVDGLMALIFFTLALSIFPAAEVSRVNFLNSLEWLGIVLLLGLIPGFILISISRVKFSQQEFVLFLIGTVLFCGGLADMLNHSPLIAGFICGLVTANFCRHHIRALSTVLQAEKSIYIILLLLLGASWHFSSATSLIIAGIYFLIRIIGKLAGTYLAIQIWNPGFYLPKTIGLALLSEGGLTVAIILDFKLLYPMIADPIITIIIISIFINEWLSPRFTLAQFKKDQPGKKSPDRDLFLR